MTKPRIAITLGDPAGIGPEIVSKALRDPLVRTHCRPIVVGDPLALALHRQALPRADMLPVPGLNRHLALGRASREAGRSAMASLRQALALLRSRQARALVTAPVSKESFALAGMGCPGHTEWLARESGAQAVAMLMAAGGMRAILMTRHLPLAEVSRHLTGKEICRAARLGHAFAREHLKRSPRIVLCGLNPHAGDHGLIGAEEQRVFRPALARLKREKISVAGPVPADTVFREMARGRWDLALAAYHDQGMIPLKLAAPERLVNITLGLPFIRTSPGHGTAYDIAGENQADARPMAEAILLAAAYSQA